jgi:hypothetical protein
LDLLSVKNLALHLVLNLLAWWGQPTVNNLVLSMVKSLETKMVYCLVRQKVSRLEKNLGLIWRLEKNFGLMMVSHSVHC